MAALVWAAICVWVGACCLPDDQLRWVVAMTSLKGRTAIVTGAGSAEGIGFAIAKRLLQEDALVVITATSARIHDRAKELDPTSAQVISFVADLTEEKQVQEFVEAVKSQTGRIDILVNNAGMAQGGGSQAAARSNR